MFRRRIHLRRAPSPHSRGVNLFNTGAARRGYGQPCCYKPLRSSPVVKPAGMKSSIPCRELEFGPSRHCGTSYTMATWPLRDRKPVQVAEQGGGGGVGGEVERGGGGGGGDREWKGGGIRSLGRMRETREGGGGLIGGGHKLALWSKLTTHNSLSKT